MNSENINFNASESSDEISLRELIVKINEWWKYLRSKWIIILVCGILGGILGFIFSYLNKPIYTATTTFVLESGESGGGLSQYAGLASMVGVDLGGSGGGIFQGDNILELYKSRTMIAKTLLSPIDSSDKKLLIERYLDITDFKKKGIENPDILTSTFSQSSLQIKETNPANTRLRDSILREVVDEIKVNYLTVAKQDKKLNIIKVEVKSNDELFSKSFNDALVKNVNEFFIQTKTKKSLENVSILQHKADSVRAVMRGAIYSAAVISDATPNLNPTRQVQRNAPVQSAQFNAETNKTILAEMVKNLEMSKLALIKETPLIQVVDQPIFPLAKDQLGRLKGTLIGFLLLSLTSILFLFLKMIFKNILSSE